MSIRTWCVRLFVVSLLLTVSIGSLLGAPTLSHTSAPFVVGERAPARMYVMEEIDGRMACRLGTSEQANALANRAEPVQVIYPPSGSRSLAAGLQITLRGTSQLDSYPAAKAAFVRAAKIWEGRIANSLSVTIDVDFGPTIFGQPFENEGILGGTLDSAYTINYPGLRSLLLARADSAAETSLYNSLPVSTVPTNLGNVDKVDGAYILLKALGASLPNDAPLIGFNSNYAFDLDPSDGIDAGKFDFEAVAVHEMGHALGFGSAVGDTELTPPATSVRPTVWDLFRFRPGVTTATFQAAQRPMSSGGSHVHFAGGPQIAMSTGRGDNTGGDGQQSSHWKDDTDGNPFIGLMDPTIPRGFRGQLQQADLDAFNIMGYTITGGGGACAETEPNEVAANATPIVFGTPCTGNVTFIDPSSITINFTDGTSDKIEDLYRVTLSSPGKLTVRLSWTFTGADLDVYLLSSSEVLAQAASSANPEEFTTNSTLAAGTYYVGVSAYSSGSAYTLLVSSTGSAPATPAAPSNLVATPTSSTTINLSWSDNATNETGYVVEAKAAGSGFIQVGSVLPANATSTTITGATPGVTFTFRVKARNGAGDSGYSNEASATPTNTGGPCVANSTTACLLSNRFRVSVRYINAFVNPPQPGDFLGARLASGSSVSDTATFGLTTPLLIEAVVRILDVNQVQPGANRFDIYAGGLTDLEYTVTVTDTQTGRSKTYRKPPGTSGTDLIVVDRVFFQY